MPFEEYDPQVRDSLVEHQLKEFARDLKKITPPGWGFMVIMAKHGEGGGCIYLSSVEREGAIQLLKEMVKKFDG